MTSFVLMHDEGTFLNIEPSGQQEMPYHILRVVGIDRAQVYTKDPTSAGYQLNGTQVTTLKAATAVPAFETRRVKVGFEPGTAVDSNKAKAYGEALHKYWELHGRRIETEALLEEARVTPKQTLDPETADISVDWSEPVTHEIGADQTITVTGLKPSTEYTVTFGWQEDTMDNDRHTLDNGGWIPPADCECEYRTSPREGQGNFAEDWENCVVKYASENGAWLLDEDREEVFIDTADYAIWFRPIAPKQEVTRTLEDRVVALEDEVKKLRTQITNLKLKTTFYGREDEES